MALIYCPECGVQVSDKAEKCPSCAYPINKEFSPQEKIPEKPQQVVVKSKEGCFLQTLNTGCVIIAIFIVIIILVAIFSI